MSSSELIIRRSRASYRGEGAFTTDGVAEGPIAPFRQPLSGLAGQAAGTVIRGRRSGLGPSASPEGRRGSSAPASDSDGPGLDRPGLGPTSSALLQVDLRELRRRIEDRGYAAGRARAEGELAAAIEAAGALAARVEALAPREATTVAHALVELSTAIAGRIVGAELRLDPALLVRALEAAVVAINGSPEARVMLHPDQLATVRQAWEAAHGSAFLGKRWTFEPDASLPPGGCVLRYEHGFVAAGIEAQLELITAALEEAIPGLRAARPVDSDEVDR